jgi:hypothetical protein
LRARQAGTARGAGGAPRPRPPRAPPLVLPQRARSHLARKPPWRKHRPDKRADPPRPAGSRPDPPQAAVIHQVAAQAAAHDVVDERQEGGPLLRRAAGSDAAPFGSGCGASCRPRGEALVIGERRPLQVGGRDRA